MNTSRLKTSLLALALCGAGAQAQTLQDWLPSRAEVAAVLHASPHIRSARDRQDAMVQRARGLETGAGEWTLRLNQQQRRARDPQQRFAETTFALERPVRLWGKAALDAQLAEQDRALARIFLADALHESSRDLLNQWFSALHAALNAESGEQELQLARQLHRQARVRLAQGDIAPLDARLAEAELLRSQASARLAQAELERSAVQWQRLYPGLRQPRWPQPPLADQKPFVQRTLRQVEDLELLLQQHHELRLLKGQAQRQQQLAERLARERWADATVGVYTARERAGAEQLVGLSLALPLPGVYRDSQAHAALAEAGMLAQQAAQLERELTARFETRARLVLEQEQALEDLQAAAVTQRLAADKSLIAYNMGEHSMTEVIHNRRLANEQQLANKRLLLDWLLNLALIELDAHRLWDLDD